MRNGSHSSRGAWRSPTYSPRRDLTPYSLDHLSHHLSKHFAIQRFSHEGPGEEGAEQHLAHQIGVDSFANLPSRLGPGHDFVDLAAPRVDDNT